MTVSLIDVSNLTVRAPGGRPLFDGLTLRLARDRVALVGRNGIGKSTLLAVLAGLAEADAGRVKLASQPHFVPQTIPARGLQRASDGERRRAALAAARQSDAEILLLDEPTEDLDEDAVSWLRSWLSRWQGCLVTASHDRRLLVDFCHFLIASEAGCRYFGGTLAELDAELARDHDATEERYARSLNRLAASEEHGALVARRKARKKRYGRCSELDRATPRVRLNQKRDQAQVSHGKLARVRAARLDSIREWSKSTRRALPVRLPLELFVPVLPPAPIGDVVLLRDASARTGDGLRPDETRLRPDETRLLFQSLDLRIARERIGVVGPNAAGKTTLLAIVLGRRDPASGSAWRDRAKIGAIAQGGADWMLDETLVSYLSRESGLGESSVQVLRAHRFPLALAGRPLRSLSPGERARGALICLVRRSPPPELLVLDEPTYSLDLVGQRAMTDMLRAWPGGLLVASHDRAFLSAIGIDVFIRLGG